jgi:hypothetical protein
VPKTRVYQRSVFPYQVRSTERDGCQPVDAAQAVTVTVYIHCATYLRTGDNQPSGREISAFTKPDSSLSRRSQHATVRH